MGTRLITAAAMASAALLAFAGTASADSDPVGVVYGSGGVLSGNLVQVPVDLDLNLCGNSINVVGLLNPAFGNTCTTGKD
ncbi:chaplin [Streptomyces sp. NPDC085946]|uniref:chaplin n=1 Tax=Streptomyces sp. NPDC085946 TaxID=3365744 RepID=UPI0037D5E513